MARVAVIGGTGYAGAAIVSQAAGRGHQVTSVSRSRPQTPTPDVAYVHGDVDDEDLLAGVIGDSDVVVATLSPRGAMTPDRFRAVNRLIARLADTADARLFVVGGYSSLRPAAGADRFVTDLSQVPTEMHPEILAGAALVLEDLPAAPETLDWVFVSPPLGFGAHAPTATLGHYRLGDEVAVSPDNGGAISAADYALGLVDLIESGDHHREQVNLAA